MAWLRENIPAFRKGEMPDERAVDACQRANCVEGFK
jgi:hypothetical protein